MQRTLVLLALLCGGCDKVKELKAFFQAQPLDDKTALEVDTVPHLGSQVPGTLSIDGNKAATRTPHTQKPMPPGKHTLRVEAKGFISQEMEVEAKEGEVTQISLALKPLPGAPPVVRHDPPAGDDKTPGRKKGAKHDKDDEPEPTDNEPTVHVTKHLLVTTAPAQPVFLDGAAVGNGVGLKLDITRSAGELKVGDGEVVFSYTNKRTGLHMRIANLGDRSAVVDGNAISAKKPSFDLDTRPKRVEVTTIEGKKIVAMMKLVE